LSYVGQTKDAKLKAGKPYAYGVSGRWNDHLSCSKTTPLGRAIQEYGATAFTVETLESGVDEEHLDDREAYWISTLNTIVPKGYNKMRHGRCRHRSSSRLVEFYVPTTVAVKLRPIKKDGVPRLVYVYLIQQSGEEVRLVFGQGTETTYAQAVAEATAFVAEFANIPVDAPPHIYDTTANEYSQKLLQFDGKMISRIRIAKWNSLVAVHIDGVRICFGGKRISYDDAVEKARAFARELYNRHTEAILIDEASKSATGGCVPS
jgi:hypothetical protein